MMERGKKVKSEKGEWGNGRHVLWRGNIRGMERRKLWIGVWIRKNEREGEICGE